MFYYIDGYFNDDGSEFSDFLVCEFDSVDFDGYEYDEDDVFFFGLPRDEAKKSIGTDQSHSEFTITAVS